MLYSYKTFKKSDGQQFFDEVETLIKQSSNGNVRPLKDCPNTISSYKKENKSSHEYRELAFKFKQYCEGVNDESADYYFYKYLKSLKKENEYEFPLKNDRVVTAKVDIFNPFEIINGEEIIKPQWHLLIAAYAYLDVAYNHPESEVLERTGWDNKQLIIDWKGKNNTINTWLEEAIVL